MGAPINDYHSQSDKTLMHGRECNSFEPGMILTFTKDMVLHYNLFQLSQIVYSDLGIIDAFRG
jgi:hypothetical protein